jgi:hypothetical protein
MSNGYSGVIAILNFCRRIRVNKGSFRAGGGAAQLPLR